jgi:DNA invertase Pin-like site-specific DNA recombinase
MKVGYGRTSTVDQIAGIEAQIEELRAAGCEELFHEQVSAVASTRPEFEKAMKFVRKGDTLVVTKVDRLARSMRDLCAIVDNLRAKGAHLKVLGTDIDTASATGSLCLNLLGSFAEFERRIMLERQKVGIARARADKKYKGRKPLAADKVSAVKSMHEQGHRPTDIARRVGIGRTSVYRILGLAQ